MIRRLLLLPVLFLLVCLAFPVWAQDGGLPLDVPAPRWESHPLGLFEAFGQALQGNLTGAAILIAVVGALWAFFRFGVPLLPAGGVRDALGSPWATVIVAALVLFGTALFDSLLLGAPFSGATVLGAAWATVTLVLRLGGQQAARDAGAAASAAVTDKAAAVDVLRRGPQP